MLSKWRPWCSDWLALDISVVSVMPYSSYHYIMGWQRLCLIYTIISKYLIMESFRSISAHMLRTNQKNDCKKRQLRLYHCKSGDYTVWLQYFYTIITCFLHAAVWLKRIVHSAYIICQCDPGFGEPNNPPEL